MTGSAAPPRSTLSISCARSPSRGSRCRRRWCGCPRAGASSGDAMQALCFLAGANSIFYGDKLLTTGNPDVAADRALLAKLGLDARRVTCEHLIADLERDLAAREAAGLQRDPAHARLGAGPARRRRRPRARCLREQRLSRPRQSPGRRRRGARRRGALGRRRGCVAPHLRPLRAARGARSRARRIRAALRRRAGADVLVRAISPISRS